MEGLALALSCTQPSATRAINKLYADGLLYVHHFERSKAGVPTAFYAIKKGDEQDATMIPPLTNAEAYRRECPKKRAARRVKENAVKRWNRTIGKDVRLGLWGI
jgi:hypothetical protein